MRCDGIFSKWFAANLLGKSDSEKIENRLRINRLAGALRMKKLKWTPALVARQETSAWEGNGGNEKVEKQSRTESEQGGRMALI